jgi:hypothetical protein
MITFESFLTECIGENHGLSPDVVELMRITYNQGQQAGIESFLQCKGKKARQAQLCKRLKMDGDRLASNFNKTLIQRN